MSDKEQEALARQLWALYAETRGYIAEAQIIWEDLAPVEREAWIQVAQFVANMAPPQVIVFNDIKLSDVDREQMQKQLKEAEENYEHWGYGIPDHR